jgi:Gpi18-like mannosyltransferase
MLAKLPLQNTPIKLHHLLLFVVLIVFIPQSGYYFDSIDRPFWIQYMVEHGLTNAYGSKANYLPLPLYLLYLFGLFFKNPADVPIYFYNFKICVLVFDFAAVLGLVHAFKKYNRIPFVEYLALLNVAFLYNTVFWGQQDAIHCALIAFSLVCLLKNKPIWGVVFLVLAVNSKLQSVIIIPVVGIVLLYYIAQNIRLLPQIIATVLVIQILILLPFLLTHQLKTVWGVITNSVGFFPQVASRAYNLWFLFTKSDPSEINDTSIFIVYSYRTWGFGLFFSLSALSLMPLLLATWQYAKHKIQLDQTYFALTFLTAAVISLVFFFANTQMHERYSHPALILLFGYGLLTRRFWLFGTVSIAYFYNQIGVYNYFDVPQVKPELISLLYLLTIIICFWDMLKMTTKIVEGDKSIKSDY